MPMAAVAAGNPPRASAWACCMASMIRCSVASAISLVIAGRPRDQLDDARPDENPVAFLELRTADLLAVDERAVGGPQIGDRDAARGERQLRMLARDHVLDQHQVQVAGAADHELTGIGQRVLASLIFSRDEAECVGTLAHAGLGCERASLR